jgi:hypothetical protein
MRWWHGSSRTLRGGLVGLVLLVALVVVAKIHACACTGGSPAWTPVMPEADGSG